MRNFILMVFLACFAMTVNAQTTTCPNTFTCGSTFTDPRSNNTYPTVQIGTQCWMAKNLYETKYVNGDAIPYQTGAGTNSAWTLLTSGAWCTYSNVASYLTNGYGAIYNDYAAISDTRGLCPVGWYVPTSNEWCTLISYFGSYSSAAYALSATTMWIGAGTASNTNSSGFTALPGGDLCSGTNGSCPSTGQSGFAFMGSFAYFWSLNPPNTLPVVQVGTAQCTGLTFNALRANAGASVRCFRGK